MKSTPYPLVVVDSLGVITEWNGAAESYFAWAKAEVVGRPLIDVLIPSTLQFAFLESLARIGAGGSLSTLGQSVEMPMLHRNGKVLTVELAVWPVLTNGATLYHLTLRDTTRALATETALAASEERVRLLVDGAREYALFMLDPAGLITTWNAGAQRIKGYTSAEAIGKHFSMFYGEADRARSHPQYELAEAESHGRYEEEGWRIRKDGTQFWANVVINAIRSPEGTLQGFSKLTRDLTERRMADLALRSSEERFRGAFFDAPIGVSLVDLEGRFLQVNPALCAITGYSIETMLTLGFQDLSHPGDDPKADRAALTALAKGEAQSFTRDKRYVRADGEEVWVNINVVPVHDGDGAVIALLSHTQDITQRRLHEDHLVELAHYDPLTGLLNRNKFCQSLEAHLDRCRRSGPVGAVLMLDLDYFKRVNDSLGHNAGDELIISLAGVLRARLRSADIVARLGGDEFAVLLPEATREDAEQVAAALGQAIRTAVTTLNGSRPRTVTASIGIAVIDDPTTSAVELLGSADLAMFEAKESGRDRHTLYEQADLSVPKTKARITWARRIETALETDAFELWAQPILEISTKRTHTHELLLRMRTPEGDIVTPGDFLYIAERLGMITEIDHWVTTHAIDLLALLQRHRPEQRIEVNISGLSVGDEALRNHIANRLSVTGVNPAGLVFEITETAAVERIQAARDFAEHLGNLGCHFALDDFGAGFGSFYYLKHLPFDYVKIDGEFIAHCTSNLTDRLVIESVVNICRGLGKQTVAEFVGDEATLRFLEDQHVDYAQGYHIGQPVPVSQAFPELVIPPIQRQPLRSVPRPDPQSSAADPSRAPRPKSTDSHSERRIAR